MYGEGEWSEVASIKSGAVPSTMSKLKAINPPGDSDSTRVVLSWKEPNTNGSDITEYEIRIKKKGLSNDDFRPAGALCDGSDASVIASKTCEISSQVLKDQWGYVAGDLFVGDVRAKNTWGWGNYSEPNDDRNGGTVFKLVTFTLTKGRKLNGNQ